MVNITNGLTEKNEFIQKMIDYGEWYMSTFPNDNPWWNNSKYGEFGFPFRNSHLIADDFSNYSLEEFVKDLIWQICQQRRTFVMTNYCNEKHSQEAKKNKERADKLDSENKKLENNNRELTSFKEQIEDLKETMSEILSTYYKEEEQESGFDYWHIGDLKELMGKNESKPVEVSIAVIRKWEQDAKVHYESLTETSKEWNERKLLHWVRFALELNRDKDKLHDLETKSLEKEISDKAREVEEEKKISERSNEIIADQKKKIKELEQKLAEEAEKLEKANQIILDEKSQKRKLQSEKEEIKSQLSLFTRSLSSLPKQNKFKQLGARIKTKFQQLVEKKKHLTQELIARIEVKTK